MVYEQKNNIQTNALNVGTGKHSEYYLNQNDSTVSISENSNNINTNSANFTDSLFKDTQYKVKNGCLYVSSERKGNIVTRKLANFVPFLKGETTLDNGIEIKKYLLLGGIHCSGKYLPTIKISAGEFNNMNWITKNWGLNCNIETGQAVKDYIRHAIQCTAKNAEQKNIYSHTGWTKINNKLIFLCNGLYLDENIEQFVELDGKLTRYCLTDVTKRNIDEDLETIFKLLDTEFIPHQVILPLLAIAFLSPLNHFFKIADCEPKLVLFLIGKTGAKKSTLSSLILSLFGNFSNTDLPISFKDTGYSILEQAFILKDVLTVIDDFHPSNKQDEQNLNKNAQTIMRAYGDRIGRNRLNPDSTLMVAKAPRGNAILTGESAPDISESGTARYITIELKKNDINTTKLTELQELARNDVFKGIMSFYIRWLYLTVNTFGEKTFSERLRAKFIDYRKLFENELGKENISAHSRIPEALSHLLIGLETFFECIRKARIIENEKKEDILVEFIGILIFLAKQQTESVKQDKPSIKFVTKLNALLESKQAIVFNKQNYINAGGIGFVGYEDENYYYLIPDITHKMVKKLCEEQGEIFPTTYKSLLSHLKDDGLIEVANDSNTKQLRLGNKNSRFIWLKKREFYNIIS